MGRFRQDGETIEARRRAAAGDVRAFERRCQQVGRLLADAHGYLVRGPGDKPIGRVAGLSHGRPPPRPEGSRVGASPARSSSGGAR